MTLDGAGALKDCDINTAHDKFTQAHASDPTHPEAALGFALTDLALLPEDPIVTGVLAKLGFTGALDMQALVFGPDGVLARSSRGDSCSAIESFARTTIPYPPLADTSIDKASLIERWLRNNIARSASASLFVVSNPASPNAPRFLVGKKLNAPKSPSPPTRRPPWDAPTAWAASSMTLRPCLRASALMDSISAAWP